MQQDLAQQHGMRFSTGRKPDAWRLLPQTEPGSIVLPIPWIGSTRRHGLSWRLLRTDPSIHSDLGAPSYYAAQLWQTPLSEGGIPLLSDERMVQDAQQYSRKV
jgi:hypothetical protein